MTYHLLTTPGGHGYLDGDLSTMPALVEGLKAIALQADAAQTQADAAQSTELRDEMAAGRWWRGSTSLPDTADLTALDPGMYSVFSESIAASLGLPEPARGSLMVTAFGSAGGVQVWLTNTGDRSHTWSRFKVDTANTWSPWRQQDADGLVRGALTLDDHLDDVLEGPSVWQVRSGPIATAVGAPVPSIGIVEVYDVGNGTTFQRYTATGSPARTYIRSRGGAGSWVVWTQVVTTNLLDEAIDDALATVGPGGGGGVRGFRTVPLAVSAGNNGGTTVGTSGGARVPLQWNAPITRWRLHATIINPRYGTTPGFDVTVGQLRMTTHVGGGQSAGPATVLGQNVTVPADGTEWVSPWQTDPIGDNATMILTFDWSAPGPMPGLSAGCWTTAQGDAHSLDPVRTQATRVPLDLWIEAETYATTAVVAVVGDSNSIGLGCTAPVLDSPLSQWCRTNGALPVHFAFGGARMQTITGPGTEYMWSRWDGLAHGDSVINAMGTNDVFADGDNLATLQQQHADLLAAVHARVSPVIYDTTVIPSNDIVGGAEDVRRAYNTWLAGTHHGARDLFDYSAAVSSDDENIDPGFAFDALHVNTAGAAAMAAAINRPIVSPVPVAA